MLSTVINISFNNSSKALCVSTFGAGAGDDDEAFELLFCKPFPADEIPESIDTVRGLPIVVAPVATGLAFLDIVAYIDPSNGPYVWATSGLAASEKNKKIKNSFSLRF